VLPTAGIAGSDYTPQYLHVRGTECEEFRFVSKNALFLYARQVFDTYTIFIAPDTFAFISQ
jgi:hypothetical protein